MRAACSKEKLEFKFFSDPWVDMSVRFIMRLDILGNTVCHYKASNYVLMFGLNSILDIDECTAESSPCDENANCTNTVGSYNCICKQGFSGNGTICQGT